MTRRRSVLEVAGVLSNELNLEQLSPVKSPHAAKPFEETRELPWGDGENSPRYCFEASPMQELVAFYRIEMQLLRMECETLKVVYEILKGEDITH